MQDINGLKVLIGVIVVLLLVAHDGVLSLGLRVNNNPTIIGDQIIPVEINVFYSNPQLSSPKLFIRGNLSPIMSWNRGLKLEESKLSSGVYQLQFNTTQNQLQNIGNLFEFKALINDQDWEIGTNNQFILSLTARNSISIYPWFYQKKGSIQTLQNVYSPILQNYRNISLYLPPSYFENQAKTFDNLLIMHDGQNLFDPATAFLNQAWMIQNTLDPLITSMDPSYAMEEIIVIGIDNTPDRLNEYTYSKDKDYGGGKGDLYLDFIEHEVLPYLLAKFSQRWVLRNDKLGILGSSLGGLISCYAGWTRSSIYSKIGCMSSSFWWNNQDFNNTILNRPYTPSNINIYLDSGDSGDGNDDVIQTQTVTKHILNKGSFKLNQNVYYYLDKGASHNEYYWGRRFHEPMLALYKKSPLYSKFNRLY
ncbi:esterase [Naegleria gruberi]|uniref:Esterase n=1 Tax=Naegleria gruberi TaxID=5762 RepID=D2VMS7_NAEGR|nr:esterase [Naegleria gruberi]EFC41786.1 esterase [Naegleria gruberi]|eukprot:XP_002674530.1 esterase [Naegleria gruberi]